MTDFDWSAWLREWSATLLASVGPDTDLPPEVAASGWLGASGATDAQLGALEARVGTPLPPSYRAFLRASNGFRQPGVLVPRLLPVEEVDWFRVRYQEVIDIWSSGAGSGERIPGDESGGFERYLPTALQVSDMEYAGTAVYLLNPRVVNAEGEWEAFYFAHWVPGVNRYPSFRALMEEERNTWTPVDAEPGGPSRNAHSFPGTLWNALRRILRFASP